MSEHASTILAHYETASETFSQLEALQTGAGILVVDYLRAERSRLCQDPAMQQAVLNEGEGVLSLQRYYELVAYPRTTPALEGRRQEAAANLGAIARLVIECNVEGDEARDIIATAEELGTLTVSESVEPLRPAEELDMQTVEARLLHFINTSAIGAVIRPSDIVQLFGPLQPSARRVVNSVLAALSPAEPGRVLHRTGSGYMVLHKPGNSEVVERELDEGTDFTEAHAQIVLQDIRRVRGRSLQGDDRAILNRYLTTAQTTIRASGHTRNDLREQALGTLVGLFRRPWDVVHTLEILPGSDARYYLLSELLDSERRNEVFELLQRQ
jgi:hypothetical protein